MGQVFHGCRSIKERLHFGVVSFPGTPTQGAQCAVEHVGGLDGQHGCKGSAGVFAEDELAQIASEKRAWDSVLISFDGSSPKAAPGEGRRAIRSFVGINDFQATMQLLGHRHLSVSGRFRSRGVATSKSAYTVSKRAICTIPCRPICTKR